MCLVNTGIGCLVRIAARRRFYVPERFCRKPIRNMIEWHGHRDAGLSNREEICLGLDKHSGVSVVESHKIVITG